MSRDPNAHSLDRLAQLVEGTRDGGRARFSMVQEIGVDDDDPRTFSGVVDLCSGDFASDTICFVDGIHYGRETSRDETWTSFAWEEGHLPISPLWLVLILLGAESADMPDLGDAVEIHGYCDLHRARTLSGVTLAGLGTAAAHKVSVVAVVAPEVGRLRQVTARFEDWVFTCNFSDFGAGDPIEAPEPSAAL